MILTRSTSMKTLCRLACVAAVLILAGGLRAADKVNLNVGDKAPTFTAKDDQGKDWNSADHIGKKVIVVYFYPADMTGGCTRQACGYRDEMKNIEGKGVEVVGISGDSVENHPFFKEAKDR